MNPPRRRHGLSPAQRGRAVAEIYARVPIENLQCRGFCHDSCGAIGYSAAERRVIAYKHGSPPVANGFNKGAKFTQPDDIMCDKLTPEKRCSIYEDRPLICRVYGLLRALRCPHGCVPSEWMEDAQIVELLTDLDAIEGRDEQSHKLAAVVSAAAKGFSVARFGR